MRIDLFDYDLPAELIAQEPAARRDQSRLLVIDRGGSREPEQRRFCELPEVLEAGDLLVVNDARVSPLRLRTRRASGGAAEVLLLREVEAPREGVGPVWLAMVRGGRRLGDGEALHVGDGDDVVVVRGDADGGLKMIELPSGETATEFLDAHGEMPLPPYIGRRAGDGRAAADRRRYQTVYARRAGAVAAPTAGLHFTAELLTVLRSAGIGVATLSLQVGPGTFQPVRVEEVSEHTMAAEEFVLPRQCVDAIVATKQAGGRVVGVGTTVVRTLEYAAGEHGDIAAAAGEGTAEIFIYPGFNFAVIDAMLTNFHLPRSTPMLMASAFAGRERLLGAYELAVAEGFRFYSYGDAMLIR